MATESKSSLVKGKLSAGNKDGSLSSSGIAKNKVDSSFIKKKVVQSSTNKISVDAKQKSASSSVSKTEVKAKTTATSSSTKTVTKTVTKTREKKVYSLPGQKYDTPEEREPLRIFYESLSQKIPSSEMAELWLMEHGILSPEKAKKAFEKKQRKQKQQRLGTPIKSPTPPPPSRPESSKKQQVSKNGEGKAKKRILDESDDDDDFILSHKRRKGFEKEGVLDIKNWKKKKGKINK